MKRKSQISYDVVLLACLHAVLLSQLILHNMRCQKCKIEAKGIELLGIHYPCLVYPVMSAANRECEDPCEPKTSWGRTDIRESPNYL
jgi:hypothetical protein